MSDDDEGIMDLIGRPAKDKENKHIDEQAARKAKKRRKRVAITLEQ